MIHEMDAISIISVALGLAMDCFAVSIATGAVAKRAHMKTALKIAVAFGGFQAIMPVIGWVAGVGLAGLIEGIDHWLAFGILAAIGCKMIYEAFRLESEEKGEPAFRVLILLAVATSIDALAVGLSFAFLGAPVLEPAAVIGVVAFCVSFLGIYAGKRFGHIFEGKVEVAGGVVLIAIGVKILLEHIA